MVENITDNSKITFSKTSSFVYKNASANINNWYLNQMISKVENYILQKDTSIESKKIEQSFEYNETTRLLTKKTHMPNTNLTLETTFVYNNLGNLVSTVDKDLQTQIQKVKSFTFDSNGLNVISSVNEIGHKEFFSFDLNDKLLTYSDSNGIKTTYSYDLNGKKVSESKAGTASVSYEYSLDSSLANSVYSINIQSSSGIKKKTLYDSLNRVLRTITYGFNSEQIFEDTFYNSNGQVRRKSSPYKELDTNRFYFTYEYDEMLRETKRIEPGNAANNSIVFTTQYKGLNVVKQDSLGNYRFEERNILGQIVSVLSDLNATAYYSYDPLNNLVKIVDPTA